MAVRYFCTYLPCQLGAGIYIYLILYRCCLPASVSERYLNTYILELEVKDVTCLTLAVSRYGAVYTFQACLGEFNGTVTYVELAR